MEVIPIGDRLGNALVHDSTCTMKKWSGYLRDDKRVSSQRFSDALVRIRRNGWTENRKNGMAKRSYF